jgi:5'-methylthioadenosine phosphorylase
MAVVGIIGGSGLYEMEGFHKLESITTATPFGEPSDQIIRGEMQGVGLLFLPRHGRGHRVAPHCINYRANIYALKQLGAEQIISVSAVGSLKESIHPGEIVLVDQYIDRTCSRPSSFFEDFGCVVHVSLADPVDHQLVEALHQAALSVGAKVHKGGTYICIEGPQFSTRAESNLFRAWGADVVGMTNLPEARLAREAELPYASIAMVTDYDCWHEVEDDVNAADVIEVLNRDVEITKKIITAALPKLPDPRKSPAAVALRQAVLTAREHLSPEICERLQPLLRGYLQK